MGNARPHVLRYEFPEVHSPTDKMTDFWVLSTQASLSCCELQLRKDGPDFGGGGCGVEHSQAKSSTVECEGFRKEATRRMVWGAGGGKGGTIEERRGDAKSSARTSAHPHPCKPYRSTSLIKKRLSLGRQRDRERE